MDPASFLGSVWGYNFTIIWRVKYLFKECLDP